MPETTARRYCPGSWVCSPTTTSSSSPSCCAGPKKDDHRDHHRGGPHRGVSGHPAGPGPPAPPRGPAPAARGAGRRSVGTPGLRRALTADERRALLAHEASHLRHRHAWWLLAAELAVAANPMLSSTVRAIGHAVERWADEDAARAVTDRRLVARTLARTALLIRAAAPSQALPATGGDVPGRVRALLEPPPRPRVVPLAVLSALLVATTLAAGTVQRRGDALLDQAGPYSPPAAPGRHWRAPNRLPAGSQPDPGARIPASGH